MFPRYTYPPGLVLNAAASLLMGGRRSFRADSTACIARLQPPLQVQGSSNIPRAGPCLLIFNHYYRPGFSAWWMSFAIASVVPQEIHFVMTGELTYPGKWYALLGQAGSRLLLRGISRMYGFTTMPPMPPRPTDVKARAASVRATLAYFNTHPRSIIGLAPEGGDQPGGRLNWPAAGAGRFIALLTSPGIPIVPLGVYEESGRLCLSFGKAYVTEYPSALSADERDHWVIKASMQAIAKQLPFPLRGEFG
jgi:1-acyl-sn-glycerol-3-phosphate acyltransferase